MKFNDQTYEIIGTAMEVHSILGPGLLESTYQSCLAYELKLGGFEIERELSLPIIYKDMLLEKAYRMDIVVNCEVVIETKCVAKILPVHEAQILTYMRLGGYKVGLLINFNQTSLAGGIKRFVM